MGDPQKTVLLGVTGCVAIYKACEVLRGLQKAGIRVKVVMTEHATHFIDPTLFRSLTREPVAVGLFDDAPGDPIHHISLAKEADLFLIAPCTANVMAKMAHGICDDLLTTTALATTAPILIAPAMNVNMYEHPATRKNMEVLKGSGVRFVDVVEGYLACGDEGKGKLAPFEDIVNAALEMLSVKRDLAGKRVLITAGPTVEPIDPVRFISNRSSGKSGYAIADAALARGAEVVLVSGPVSIEEPAGAQVVRVSTACQMLEAASNAFPQVDIAIFTAAVCDMRPSAVADKKLKKGIDGEALSAISLTENPDILATLAGAKRSDQLVVGYAAETENVIENAKDKLSRKNADLIVANLVGGGKAFGTEENTVSFVSVAGVEELPCMGKRRIADELLDRCLKMLEERG
ncbi:MAG: bifunctional phosphopantothenoylcysteine decarboxylase/phosphopantothenate--cysteine ligase CoaBC [Eggerthellaceae bacterium]|nr:bifunctional phosphopantothenoylcysteine decarboxylase/phosphopantothenate--cysteine ligase CoaBC [Eggerthellaceae bacterium]